MAARIADRRPFFHMVAGLVVVLVAALVLFSAWLAPAPVAASEDVQALATQAPVIPMVFPLAESFPWTDTFGAPRSGGRTHEGNDIMVPKMTPLLAVVDGTLDWMNLTGKLSTYNNQPYYNLLLRGDDDNDYFYIHMNNDTPGTDDGLGGVEFAYAPGLTNGSHVTAGQLIGWAGDSGNAEDVGSHLHFELHLGGYKNPVDPYASLVAAPLFDAGGGTTATTAPTTTASTAPTTATTAPGATAPPTTTTTKPPATTTTTLPEEPGPGGQLDPEIPDFTDVRLGDWFFDDLSLVYTLGVVKGSSDGTFRPYAEVSRAQFAAFVARAFVPEALDNPAPAAPTFSDVPPSFWGYAEIEAAAAAGLVRGTGDGSHFSPNAPMTRAQMAAMLCRALGLDESVAAAATSPVIGLRVFADVPQDYWAAPDISAAYVAGLVSGGSDGRYRPEETTKRAHAAAVIARALRLREGDAGV